ncbi:LOW QUALITY PROTEIN: hypothetical protein NC653_028445 [Populus alba x Populus x berolinensis]|uniref:Uncharacterized protein n=1 Tax=Populus alba x Populus x berolinensis TaxID=444605 RepID=A0AAD6M820_9ROSI|nr:LOW QUALITY PROTEIN: hypothetical protein NC653_028445 [Populus alba x Populus x berolinensis]
MFSIENPPVPDPPCSSSQPKYDERASSVFPQVVLIISFHLLICSEICQTQTKSHGLDHPTPLPNFSIKKIMYFKARSKDIKNSWPFFSKKSCNFV